MSTRQRLTADRFIGTLKSRAGLGYEWFHATVELLKQDLKLFEVGTKTSLDLWFASEAYGIKLEADETAGADDRRKMLPFTMTLSTRYSRVKLVVNDPLGWICLEIWKRSPVFEGVLERGAAEIVLTPKGIMKDPLHWVECEWLSAGGLDFPQTKDALADRLWDILFHPQIRDQIQAFHLEQGHRQSTLRRG